MGQEEEQASDELRQAVQEHQAILQEGHHEEDGAKPEAGVPVLPSVLLISASSNTLVCKKCKLL